MLGRISDVDLRLIRIFLTIVDARGVSAAQNALNVSQPTISSQLGALEERLGYSLCDRGRSGFRLTPKGERFASLARRFLITVDEFKTEAHQLDSKLVGQLNIGAIGHITFNANARFGRAIARFRQRDEAVTFNFVLRPPGALDEQILNGVIHIGLGYFHSRFPELEYRPLFSERQFAYCGRGHALFGQPRPLGSPQLEEQAWVLRSYPVPEAPALPQYSAITATADNMEAVLVLVLSGHHLGYLPSHIANPYVELGELWPLDPATLYYDVTFHAASRLRAYQSEVVRAFLEDLEESHREMPKAP